MEILLAIVLLTMSLGTLVTTFSWISRTNAMQRQINTLRRQMGIGSPFGESSNAPDQDSDGT